MSFDNILVEKLGAIGVIKINRPSVRNALNQDTITEMEEGFEALERDDRIGVIVFTGTGDKAFAAGADINQVRGYQPMDAISFGMSRFYQKVESSPKVTIAAVNGYALGGGSELALSCDIRIASEDAKFGLPELNLAVIPAAGGTQRLSRLIGKSRALDLILTGDMITAEKAKEIGLVSAVVPTEELWRAVEEKAGKILAKGPLAVRLAKLAVHSGAETDIQTGILIEQLAQAVLYGSLDKEEGTSAFLEKRQASFIGK
ncbi:enoyl-CoA hydratase/isomerase family protein [Neobacillus sp. GCM10023253]|uniref:enoyl-CoA hydratase/isomerase family protein n=1 Tax=Neobacillus sp. GCM10023253 TaxID=3252644 RepID=UPI003605D2B9